MQEKIKVLIVDDSLVFRKAVETVLMQEEDIQVIGSAWNGVKALDFIRKNKPDIVTLDIEMPELDGLETLKAIQELNDSGEGTPIGVVMLSAFTKAGADITVKALQMGAFDFISKPETSSVEDSVEILRTQLPPRIRAWRSGKKLSHFTTQPKPAPVPPQVVRPRFEKLKPAYVRHQVLLIGVSTGGPKALNDMLPALCSLISLPILIVQHMPPKFTKSLAEQLAKKCSNYKVVEASEGDVVNPYNVYIAPGGMHMTVQKDSAEVVIALNEERPENGCRPSVDVLFRSAAGVYGSKALALILTGMGSDGNKGLSVLRTNGVYVIAQDEASSVVWGMPGSAVAAGNADEIVPLMEIPEAVLRIVKG